MNRAKVRPGYRSTDGETWSVYLRRVWPDLADIMLLDPVARATELADHRIAERLYFARQSFDISSGVPPWEEDVANFIRTLGGER
jgi:hypothetical protein